MIRHPDVTAFFDPVTSSVSYLVVDGDSRQCAIIDAVLDYDPGSGRTSTHVVDQILSAIADRGLKVAWILETHVHADHMSAADVLRRATGAKVGIGAHVTQVQKSFVQLFNIADEVAPGGGDFDHLFADGEHFAIGGLHGEVLHTPGHTPACLTYLIGDAAFVGDTLFMPDYGTARCDFPGGDAATLYRSIQRLLRLPDETRIYSCHDYAPDGRAVAWESTVKAQREGNIHIKAGTTEADFVAMRTARDKTLALPALILPSVQVNIRAGAMPRPESNEVSYLKIPLDRF